MEFSTGFTLGENWPRNCCRGVTCDRIDINSFSFINFVVGISDNFLSIADKFFTNIHIANKVFVFKLVLISYIINISSDIFISSF